MADRRGSQASRLRGQERPPLPSAAPVAIVGTERAGAAQLSAIRHAWGEVPADADSRPEVLTPLSGKPATSWLNRGESLAMVGRN